MMLEGRDRGLAENRPVINFLKCSHIEFNELKKGEEKHKDVSRISL